MQKMVREQNPRKYKEYNSYRPFLRKDFKYRCAYCTVHEGEHYGNFHIDHFKPKKRFSNLKTEYSNLYYSCDICNDYKLNTWPDTDNPDVYDFRFIDPCNDNPNEYLTISNYIIEPYNNSKPAIYTITHLRLNRSGLIDLRKERDKIVREIEFATKLYEEIKNAITNENLSINELKFANMALFLAEDKLNRAKEIYRKRYTSRKDCIFCDK